MNINRLIFPGFWFGKSRKKDALEMARRGAGGFCIYGGTRESVGELIADLKAASPLKHVFMCADYEDGLGRWIEGTDWVLSNLAVGANGTEEAAYQKGLTLAREAKSVGIEWVFAPVLDLCDEPQNPIVNTRSFGADPHAAGRLGAALCRGLHDGGVLNSLKHFPGHGRTKTDSHLALPVLHQSLRELKQNELIPFHEALPYADSVMAGHLLFEAVDKDHPASFSRAVITDLLKREMGFGKLVFTDALCMKALGDEKQAALAALHAGVHILLAAEDSVALSDFLQTQTLPENCVSVSAQLLDRAERSLPAAPKTGFSAAEFNARYAASCAVWQGRTPALKKGQSIAYMELGNEENFAAQDFLNILKEAGIHIKKAGETADALAAVSFSNYKAFKGHINLSDTQRAQLAHHAAKYPQSMFISFGSPFGAENIPSLTARLLLFSPSKEAQICAANILLGKEKAMGRSPF